MLLIPLTIKGSLISMQSGIPLQEMTQYDAIKWTVILHIYWACFVLCKVQSLALRTHTPGALATPQNVQIKPSLQGQTLVSPLPKMSICPLKSTQLSQNLAETSRSESLLTDVTQPPSAQPLIPPCKSQSHLHLHYFHCCKCRKM